LDGELNTPQFRNLLFEGGGVEGIAYTEAIRVLDEKGFLG